MQVFCRHEQVISSFLLTNVIKGWYIILCISFSVWFILNLTNVSWYPHFKRNQEYFFKPCHAINNHLHQNRLVEESVAWQPKHFHTCLITVFITINITWLHGDIFFFVFFWQHHKFQSLSLFHEWHLSGWPSRWSLTSSPFTPETMLSFAVVLIFKIIQRHDLRRRLQMIKVWNWNCRTDNPRLLITGTNTTFPGFWHLLKTMGNW